MRASADLGEQNDRPSRIREVIRWFVLIPVVLAILFGCGTCALISPSEAQADTRSQIHADYAPWPFTIFNPINPELGEEVQRDWLLYPDTFDEPLMPTVVEGDFWPTLTPTPSPSKRR